MVDAVRAARLLGFATAATVIALGGHLLAGGVPAGPVATGCAVAVSGLAAAALTRRGAVRRVEVVVVLGAVQLVLHEIFAASGGHGADPVGHGADPVGHVGHSGHPSGLAMSLAHAAAVLVTGGLLAHGDRLLQLIRGWLRRVPSPSALRPVPVRPDPWRPVTGRRPVRPLPSLLAAAPLVRRGPPARFC
jgi:hypothetical protein